MYSFEDRMRAVALYINDPSKNSLKGWYNEYQLKLDLSAGYAGREPSSRRLRKLRPLNTISSPLKNSALSYRRVVLMRSGNQHCDDRLRPQPESGAKKPQRGQDQPGC